MKETATLQFLIFWIKVSFYWYWNFPGHSNNRKLKSSDSLKRNKKTKKYSKHKVNKSWKFVNKKNKKKKRYQLLSLRIIKFQITRAFYNFNVFFFVLSSLQFILVFLLLVRLLFVFIFRSFVFGLWTLLLYCLVHYGRLFLFFFLLYGWHFSNAPSSSSTSTYIKFALSKIVYMLIMQLTYV